MGYDSRVTGVIEIVPPVTGKPLRDFQNAHPKDGLSLKLKLDIESTETDEGVLITTTALGVAPHSESLKFYSLVAELQVIVDAFPGHQFEGVLLRDGEESGDLERYSVNPDTRLVETLRPTIVWDTDGDGV